MADPKCGRCGQPGKATTPNRQYGRLCPDCHKITYQPPPVQTATVPGRLWAELAAANPDTLDRLRRIFEDE